MKVCLARNCCLQNRLDVLSESQYSLESFYGINDNLLKFLSRQKLFLLDSGAFTFMNSKNKLKVNWEDYVDLYAYTINKHNVKHFFELDIDCVVGLKKVECLRDRLEKLTNTQCIPVWHKSRGAKYWLDMVQRYNYVAIGGIVTKEITSKQYPIFKTMIDVANKHNCKVHGLGFTNTNQLQNYKFYSVDSCSWNGIARFNSYGIFKDNAIRYVPKNGKRVLKDKMEDSLIYSYREWVKFQKYADYYL